MGFKYLLQIYGDRGDLDLKTKTVSMNVILPRSPLIGTIKLATNAWQSRLFILANKDGLFESYIALIANDWYN